MTTRFIGPVGRARFEITAAHQACLPRPHPGEELQPDHRGDRARKVGQCLLDSLDGDRPDGFGFSRWRPALLQSGNRFERLDDPNWDQLNGSGPLEDAADAVDASVDRGPAQPFLDHPSPDVPQRDRSEVDGDRLAVHLAERPERCLEVTQLFRWLSIREAVMGVAFESGDLGSPLV